MNVRKLAVAAGVAMLALSACGTTDDTASPSEPMVPATTGANAGTSASEAPAGEPAVQSTPESTVPPPPEPVSYSGSGDDVVDIDWDSRVGFLTFSCGGCTSNVIVRSDGAESLLVNAVGAYEGTRWINITDGSVTHTVTVKADAAWEMTITGVDNLPVAKPGETTSGSGDSVLLLYSDSGRADITNDGSGNFIARAANFDTGSIDLLVNEIGSYEGTVLVPSQGIVQIRSTGDWTITP